MKYIFSIFCVLFGLTSSWAAYVDFFPSNGVPEESFKGACEEVDFPYFVYLSSDDKDYKGYKCQKDGDFVKIVAYNENSKCGIVDFCSKLGNDYRTKYVNDGKLTPNGDGSYVGFFGCFCVDTFCDWNTLEEAKEQDYCEEGDGNICYKINIDDCEYKCFDSRGYLYTTECPSVGQEEVVEIEDNASATAGDAGATANGTNETVDTEEEEVENREASATAGDASATEGGEVVEAETGVVGANVVVNASEIVEKLKPYNLLKRSAWVNKDGKFNTTRLLVDTGAGAVLGTVGGVIANKVIRKNQISSGMDGYQCVVNGQTVAEYGDDFVIDIYR